MSVLMDDAENEVKQDNIQDCQEKLLNLHNQFLNYLENKLKDDKYKYIKDKLGNNIIEEMNELNKRLNHKNLEILIAGNQNAGKSTFINLLLNRKIFETNTLPCKALSIKIKNKKFNNNKEEVHCFEKYLETSNKNYNILSIEMFKDKMYDIETDDNKKNFVVYCIDNPNEEFIDNLNNENQDNNNDDLNDESLLNNKLIDISFVEIEGINSNEEDGNILFNSQYKFDFIIFILKSGEYTTVNAKNFLKEAAKNCFDYIFFIVNYRENDFRNKNDKEKSRDVLLKNIEKDFPRTFNNSKNFVHFINIEKEIGEFRSNRSEEYKNLLQCLKNFLFYESFELKLDLCKKAMKNKINVIIDIYNNRKKEYIKDICEQNNKLNYLIMKIESNIESETKINEEKKKKIEAKIKTKNKIIKKDELEKKEKEKEKTKEDKILEKKEKEKEKTKEDKILSENYEIIYDRINDKTIEDIINENEEMIWNYMLEISEMTSLKNFINKINNEKEKINNRVENTINDDFKNYLNNTLFEDLKDSRVGNIDIVNDDISQVSLETKMFIVKLINNKINGYKDVCKKIIEDGIINELKEKQIYMKEFINSIEKVIENQGTESLVKIEIGTGFIENLITKIIRYFNYTIKSKSIYY
eukprot:jgi/Orpsp1_1/1184481/evm.model.c7180000089682.1